MENKINVKLLSMAGQGGSAFGVGLMNMIQEHPEIMVLSSDMSTPAGLDKFKAAYPDHFMNVHRNRCKPIVLSRRRQKRHSCWVPKGRTCTASHCHR